MKPSYNTLSYNKLWKLLIDKKISVAQLRKQADIAPNTMTKLKKDEAVSMTVLLKICDILHCNIGDIVDYFPVPVKKRELTEEELEGVNAAGNAGEAPFKLPLDDANGVN